MESTRKDMPVWTGWVCALPVTKLILRQHLLQSVFLRDGVLEKQGLMARMPACRTQCNCSPLFISETPWVSLSIFIGAIKNNTHPHHDKSMKEAFVISLSSCLPVLSSRKLKSADTKQNKTWKNTQRPTSSSLSPLKLSCAPLTRRSHKLCSIHHICWERWLWGRSRQEQEAGKAQYCCSFWSDHRLVGWMAPSVLKERGS